MGVGRIFATIDTHRYYCDQTIYCLISETDTPNIKYLLGLISSKLLAFYFEKKMSDRKETFPKIKGVQIEELPICAIDVSVESDKALHDHVVKLVERMLAAKEELSKAKTEAETTRLERECESLDRQIDEAVYQLYGLTEEEIKIMTSEP